MTAEPSPRRLTRILWVMIPFFITLPFHYLFLLGNTPADALLGRIDSARYYTPLVYLQDAAMAQGQLALWNPFILCGLPLAANPQACTFYPPNMLRVLLAAPFATPLVSIISLRLLAIGHMALTYAGMYLLARFHRLARPTAVLAALLYSCSTLLAGAPLGIWVLTTTAAWLPLGLWLLLKAMEAADTGASIRYTVGAGLAYGMAMLAGQVQTVIYMWTLTGVLMLVWALLPRHHPSPARASRMLLAGAVLAAAVAVSAVVAAVILLPGAELTLWSSRASHAGTTVTGGRTNAFVIWPRHAHVIPPVLVAVALVARHRPREVLLYAAGLLVCIDMMWGQTAPISHLLRSLAPFRLSSPNWSAPAFLLPFSMLAALGVEALARPALTRTSAQWLAGLVLVLGAASLALCATWTLGPVRDNPLATWVAVPILVVLAAAILSNKMHSIVIPVIAILVMDLALWNNLIGAKMMPWSRQPTPYDPAFEGLHNPPASPKELRRSVSRQPNQNIFELVPVTNGLDPVMLQHTIHALTGVGAESVFHRFLMPEDVSLDNHRATLLFKRMFWLAREYVVGPMPRKSALFPPTTTAYLDAPLNDASIPQQAARDVPRHAIAQPADNVTQLVRSSRTCIEETHRIQYNAVDTASSHSALVVVLAGPMDHVVHAEFRDPNGTTIYGSRQTVKIDSGERDALEWAAPDFESAEITVVVNNAPSGGPATPCRVLPKRAYIVRDTADEADKLALRRFTPNRIDLGVGPLDGARLLVFTDAYYPGWRAYIDNEPVPILRADDAFKAIVVPAGNHEVSFIFSPTIVYLGLAISLTGTAIALGLLFRPWVVPRRRGGLSEATD